MDLLSTSEIMSGITPFKTHPVAIKPPERLKKTIENLTKFWAVPKKDNLVITQADDIALIYHHYFERDIQRFEEPKYNILILPGEPHNLTIRKIIVTWDHTVMNKQFIEHFKNIIHTKDVEIIFVHVNGIKQTSNNVDFQLLKSEIHSIPGVNQNIKFDAVYVANEEFFPIYMNIYMRYMQADLLVVDFIDQGRLKGVFQKYSVKASNICNYPLYII